MNENVLHSILTKNHLRGQLSGAIASKLIDNISVKIDYFSTVNGYNNFLNAASKLHEHVCNAIIK